MWIHLSHRPSICCDMNSLQRLSPCISAAILKSLCTGPVQSVAQRRANLSASIHVSVPNHFWSLITLGAVLLKGVTQRDDVQTPSRQLCLCEKKGHLSLLFFYTVTAAATPLMGTSRQTLQSHWWITGVGLILRTPGLCHLGEPLT